MHHKPSGPSLHIVSDTTRSQKTSTQVTFNRTELNQILKLYGIYVAKGEWRDYAIDFQKDRAAFSIFKKAHEMPLYIIEKKPAFAKKQGAYCIINTAGLILKRGHALGTVLRILEPKRDLNLVY